MALDDKPEILAVLDYYAKIAGKDLGTETLREYGQSKIRCPFHDDQHPSATVNVGTGRFRCYACSAPSGDSIDVIQGQEGIGFNEAVQWARDNLGYEDAEVRESPDERRYTPSWLPDDE